MRHIDFVLMVNADDGTKQMHEDATFCTQVALNGGTGTSSIRAWGYPTRYIRHYDNLGYIASNGGPDTFDATTSFNADVTFAISTGFAS